MFAGGSTSPELGPHCTHAVLRHQQQPAWSAVLALPGVVPVRPDWVLEYTRQGDTHMPAQAFRPWPHAGAAGLPGQVLCMTGFKVDAGGRPPVAPWS